jgi:uncharacterized protein (TIGR02284 family)
MENKDVIELLNDLIRLDVDAIHAYSQAIDACKRAEIRDKLSEFRAEHEGHIEVLSGEVQSLGGTPDVRKDFKGLLVEGFAAIVSQGDASALLAMRANEEITTRTYQHALEKDPPPGILAVVTNAFADERRHLGWIKSAIDRKIWEKAA